MSALFEIAYLSGHELFIRLEKWGWGNAEDEEEERTKNVCLKYLGCRRCFHVHASNSAQELLHCDLFCLSCVDSVLCILVFKICFVMLSTCFQKKVRTVSFV